jgi:hypothetical protein
MGSSRGGADANADANANHAIAATTAHASHANK